MPAGGARSSGAVSLQAGARRRSSTGHGPAACGGVLFPTVDAGWSGGAALPPPGAVLLLLLYPFFDFEKKPFQSLTAILCCCSCAPGDGSPARLNTCVLLCRRQRV